MAKQSRRGFLATLLAVPVAAVAALRSEPELEVELELPAEPTTSRHGGPQRIVTGYESFEASTAYVCKPMYSAHELKPGQFVVLDADAVPPRYPRWYPYPWVMPYADDCLAQPMGVVEEVFPTLDPHVFQVNVLTQCESR